MGIEVGLGKKAAAGAAAKEEPSDPLFGYTSQMQKVWEVSPILWSPSSVLADTSFMASKLDLVLKAFVAANRPLVRLLIGRGATYPAVAERLRQLFVDEAVAEIRARGMKPTASAVSLLSGVHRKDLRARELGAARDGAPEREASPAPAPLGLIGQVVGRWMSDPLFLDGKTPRPLQRGEAPTTSTRWCRA